MDSVASAAVVDWQNFREHGKRMVDEIADYYEALAKGDYTVKAQVTPSYLRPALPATCPESGESFESIVQDVHIFILPGVTHWQSPSFFGYFPANSSPAGILGDMLSDAINCIAFSWISSPAATELESICMDWLVDLLGLPNAFRSSGQGGGVIQGTASEATLVALLAARARTFEHLRSAALPASHASVPAEAREAAGVAAASHAHKEQEWHNKLVCYASDQAHSSVTKAAMIAGLHIPTQYRIIPSHSPPSSGSCEGQRAAAPYTMDVQALQRAIEKDRAAGLIPFFAVATMGTTSSGAFDPLDAVGLVCAAQGVWLHVDAAWAGAALACPELREQLHAQGLERVDSFAFNPHKWMRTNFDCCAMFVRERLWLLKALSITPVYLSSPEYCKGLVHDYRDWQIPLGRRFRSLKLWFVMRMYGAAALREQIRCHCEMAREFSRWIADDPEQRFQLTVQPSLSLVCFHMRAGDAASEAVLQSAMASGKLYMVNTKLSGRFVLRLAIGGILTKLEHVRQAWELLAGAASTVLAQNTW